MPAKAAAQEDWTIIFVDDPKRKATEWLGHEGNLCIHWLFTGSGGGRLAM
jgi:hypothetical protein